MRWTLGFARTMAGLVSALGLLGVASEAFACGGCFGLATSNAPVVGHRMAFALSEGRTVLWDQFEYSGAPEEFSWVLPVAPGAYLEASTDAWFDALEGYTRVAVQAPPLNCASGGSSGCGWAQSDSGVALSSDGYIDQRPGVIVLHRDTVGPYDTVTLRSTSGDALSEWLVQNGFVIPEDVTPIIAAYVAEGADFIALRLRPGTGVTQMTPVRVVTPNGPAILPLRMVAAGVGDWVDIVLYVIGDQRFGLPDLLEVSPDFGRLSFDFSTNDSNYLELRRAALARNEGRVFLTAYASEGDLAGVRQGRSFSTSSGKGSSTELVSLYFQQALDNAGAMRLDACDPIAAKLRPDRRVVADCVEGLECPPLGADEVRAGELECGGFDDVAAALTGQRLPRQTWLTRLELRLPRQALAMDCVVEPNVDQVAVSNSLQAQRFSNPPCDLPIFSSSLSPAPPRSFGSWVLASTLFCAFLRRRVKRAA